MKVSLNYLRSTLLVSLLLIFAITPSLVLSQNNHITNRYNGLFVELSYDSGMGAVFGSVFGALNLYDQGCVAGLKVNLDSGIYHDPKAGPNWWEYFFEPIDVGNKQAPQYRFTRPEAEEIAFSGLGLPKNRAFNLIQKYVRIKPHIQEEVDAFIRKHFKSFFVIGVHHRGTDKIIESPLVKYETTCHAIKQIIRKHYPLRKKIKIYVATDDQQFLTHLETLYPSRVIYNNFVRSADGTPLHMPDTYHYANNYQKGKEALIDCLLLSRCHTLIRPATSCLSLMSTFFNPELPVIPLNPN